MKLANHEIHIWRVNLNLAATCLKDPETLLSKDEHQRANQFKFAQPKAQYINTRYVLRTILAYYLNTSPDSLVFEYNAHGKPRLRLPHDKLAFNLSHSAEWLIIGLTLDHSIGIDIEKVCSRPDLSIARRFFSQTEYEALLQCPPLTRMQNFYTTWSRKEALIKGIGRGFNIPLNSFSVLTQAVEETLLLENQEWTLFPLSIHPHYQASAASNQFIHSLRYWNFFDHNRP